mgnify:CR=1 FL=1
MHITKIEEVFDFKGVPEKFAKHQLYGYYPHVVEDKLYWEGRVQAFGRNHEIQYAVKTDNGYELPTNRVCLRKSLAAENFRVFLDTNPNIPPEEKYKAVGGYHVGRGSEQNTPAAKGLHTAKLYESLLDCPISKDLEVVDVVDPVWPDYIKKIFKDDFYHPRHANGLYVFVSPDGINWKEYHDKPVMSILTECEDLPIGILGLDWMPSIFFDHNINEYVMYLRANMELGSRHIMYSKSKDLIKWTKPKLIKCNPEFDVKGKQNFYYPAVYPFGDKYIAFPPHFTNTIHDKDGMHRTYHNEHTVVMISNDGVNWETKGKILESNTGQHMHQPHVCSFREEDGKYILYVHHALLSGVGNLVKYEFECKNLI